MRFCLVVTVSHPSFKADINHVDVIEAISKSAYLKTLSLAPKNVMDLKNSGETSYVDQRGVTHHLKLETEAN